MSETTGIERLTQRQKEVLDLLAKGLTNEEIGGVLGLSFATVRNHVTAVLAALDVTNRTEATARYLAVEARPEQVQAVLARPAIAVLPLLALDDTPRARTIAGAVARDLSALFARSCWFPVISQVSAAGARALGATSTAIGQQLGARFLIDGALLLADTEWRLDVHIDDTQTGHCLWTERYTFPVEAIFAHLDTICATIVAHAYPVLVQRVRVGLPDALRPRDVSAWELAHLAMDLSAARDPTMNATASAYFQRAVERDPALVLAQFGLGLVAYDAVLNQWGDGAAARDRLARAFERCLELAPHVGEGYFLQARHAMTLGDHARAVAALETAIALNPSFAQAHALLAQSLQVIGRSDEALVRMQHALRLGPRSFVAGLAMLRFMRSEYPEALAAAEDAVGMTPRYTFARVLAAVSAYHLGDEPRAALHLRGLRDECPPFDPSGFQRVFGSEIDVVHRIGRALEALGAT